MKSQNLNEEDPSKLTLLMKYAVLKTNREMAFKILERGADINFQNLDGLTALHFALQKGNRSAVSFLLERNANPHLEDLSGQDCCDYNKNYRMENPFLRVCDPSKR